jgi:DNA-binding response OmpR family regulator
MQPSIPYRILVVEDNLDLAQLLVLHLRDAGYEVEVEHDGRNGLKRTQTRLYDLIILDIMLPGLDGLSVCQELRRSGPHLPILFLTSKSSEIDRVVGLELGADDYVTKPFSIKELLARVKALLRRIEALKAPPVATQPMEICAHDLNIDLRKRTVLRGAIPVELTAKEFDLLYHFARMPGRVFTRAQLLDQVWGYGHDGYDHTVNSHINRLRTKIEANAAKPRYILTVWGVGYKFAETI